MPVPFAPSPSLDARCSFFSAAPPSPREEEETFFFRAGGAPASAFGELDMQLFSLSLAARRGVERGVFAPSAFMPALARRFIKSVLFPLLGSSCSHARDLSCGTVSELSADQKELAQHVMSDLLAPFRKEDRDESMKLINKAGFDELNFAWFTYKDIGNDQVWDIWQVEGPSMLWLFRGSPHVHTWVHIREPA